MTTNHDYARDLIMDGLENAYLKGYLSKAEYGVMEQDISESLDSLESDKSDYQLFDTSLEEIKEEMDKVFSIRKETI